MKAKNALFFAFLFLLLFASFAVAKLRLTDFRAELSYRLHVSAVPIPSELLKMIAGEFRGVLADYLLLEAASFIGGNTEVEEKEWAMVARLLEQSSILDPYFKQTYTLSQGTLPWYAQKYDETFAILDRSRQHRTWDWIPGFFIGFNHFYFLGNYEAASIALMEASKVPEAPPLIASWASRLASQAGRHQAAIAFLAGMHESTEDEVQRTMLMQRMEAVEGADLLQKGVERFKEQFGRLPSSIEELLDKGVLVELPENPYNRPYTLNEEGMVEF